MTDGRMLRRGFSVLYSSIRHEPRVFAAAAASSAVYALLTVSTARVLGWTTDNVAIPAFRSGHADVGLLFTSCAVLALISLSASLAFLARRLLAGVLQFRLQATFRRRVAHQCLNASHAWLHRRPVGELLAVANSDVDAAWLPVARLPLLCTVMVMLVAAGADMVWTDPALAAIGLLLFPAVLLLNQVYQRHSARHALRSQEIRGEISTTAYESFDGALTVKILDMEAREAERFDDAAHRLQEANIAVGRARSLFEPALDLLPSLAVLGIVLVGSLRVRGGSLAPGDVVHIAYLITVIAFPLRIIGSVFKDLPRSVAGFERLDEVLHPSYPEPSDTVCPAGGGPASLELRSASVRYPGSEAAVLADLDLTLPAKEITALVGPTGSGKTTLAHLVTGLLPASEGAVLLDGVDVQTLPDGAATGRTALVAQQSFLFDDTVRGNVTLHTEFDDEAVWQALRAADAADFVRALAGGLDAAVGERGARLSGGQRQRICLARALLRRPDLLVLDDATSALDAEVEGRLLRDLKGSGLVSTVLAIGSRRSVIDIADHVVYLADGRIVDQGKPQDLYRRCPPYRDLIASSSRETSPSPDSKRGLQAVKGGE